MTVRSAYTHSPMKKSNRLLSPAHAFFSSPLLPLSPCLLVSLPQTRGPEDQGTRRQILSQQSNFPSPSSAPALPPPPAAAARRLSSPADRPPPQCHAAFAGRATDCR